jgi:hypothetical protein
MISKLPINRPKYNMGFYFLCASVIALVMVYCSEPNKDNDSSSGFKIQLYIDHAPKLNDSAYTSAKVRFTHPFSFAKDINSSELTFNYFYANRTSSLTDTGVLIDTLVLNSLRQEVTLGMYFQPKDTGDYQICLYTSVILEYADSSGNQHVIYGSLEGLDDQACYNVNVHKDHAEIEDLSLVKIGYAETNEKRVIE